MKKKNNKKWALVLVLLLVVSIGYAALASNLKINGSSSVKSATWDVYWNNVVINPESVATTEGNQARITDQKKTQVEYSVVLSEPGDFYEFTVDAVNNGTIDAMIAANGIVDGVYTDAEYQNEVTLPDAIKYSVTYADGTAIAPKHLLAKKNGNNPTTETYKVRIEYRNDNDVDPEDLEEVTDQTYYFKFSVNYVQADSTAVDRNASAIHYVNRQNEGQITPGDIIGIGETEDFYVVSSNQEKTVLLAKYNLLVGKSGADWEDGSTDIDPSSSGYGLQSIDATGGYSGNATNNGIVAFSNREYFYSGNTIGYWSEYDNELEKYLLLSPYNKNNAIYWNTENWRFEYTSNGEEAYPYVYDENSIIYQYINGQDGYVNRLKAMGAPSTITGRLLSYEEAVSSENVRRVDIDENNYTSIIFDGPDYWLGSANTYSAIYVVVPVWDDIYGDSNIAYYGNYGVRPVIEIPTSELSSL